MLLRFFSLIFILHFLLLESFGDNCSDIVNYSCFEDRVKQICDVSADWKGDTVGKVNIQYPPYGADEVQKTLQSLLSGIKDSNRREVVESDFSTTLGKSSRAPMIEFSRKLYQANMNNIFACAISADRSDQLKKMQELIDAKSPSSEIKSKLQKEQKYYQEISSGINNCDTNNQSATPQDSMSWRLARSVTGEYCRYSHYIDYLDANMQKNYSQAVEQDKKLVVENPGVTSTLESVGQDMGARQMALRDEIARAETTLPKALTAYREMQRTYGVHILLVMIMDDYMTLRNNLDLYLANISQLFEKANNAQDANKR